MRLERMDQKITLASAVYEQLRDEIITGVQPPACKLRIRGLCDHFDVGLSPVREALSRLSSEGLINQTDRRGFSVAAISLQELFDLTQARCWINEVGLRQSIAQGDGDWEEGVVLSFYRLQRTARTLSDSATERNPAWEKAHRAFHLSLVSGCNSHWIVSICARLFDASERYRHWARRAGVVRSTAESEHREIMEAAIRRDAPEAIALLNAHFRRTADLVQQVAPSAAGRNVTRQPECNAPVRSGRRPRPSLK
jgi:GntR family transcriptional regulator, carbon starvation induced regulator